MRQPLAQWERFTSICRDDDRNEMHIAEGHGVHAGAGLVAARGRLSRQSQTAAAQVLTVHHIEGLERYASLYHFYTVPQFSENLPKPAEICSAIRANHHLPEL